MRRRDGQVVLWVVLIMGVFLALVFLALRGDVLFDQLVYRKVHQEKEKLEEIKKTLLDFYASQASYIDANPDAVISTRYGDLASYGDFAKYLPLPQHDVWFSKYIVFVSSREREGEVAYHEIVVISPGPNRMVDSTYSPGSGVSLGGDDLGVVVSGLEVESQLFAKSWFRMQRLGLKIREYAKALYERDAEASMDKNYLRSTECNGSGVFSCVAGAEITATNLPSLLMLGPGDYEDLWGGVFLFDNASGQVSSSPPYTCRIGLRTPWGLEKWLVVAQNF